MLLPLNVTFAGGAFWLPIRTERLAGLLQEFPGFRAVPVFEREVPIVANGLSDFHGLN